MIYKLALNYVLKKHHDFVMKKPGGIKLDLTDADLREMNFFNANLSGSDFTKAKFNKSNFSHAEMVNCDFQSANLGGGRFLFSDLNQGDFSQADLRWGKFKRTNLSFADLSWAILRKVTLNLHVNNVQLEELEALKKAASELWDVVDRLRDRALTYESATLTSFLSTYKIRRPHDGKGTPQSHHHSVLSPHGSPDSDDDGIVGKD